MEQAASKEPRLGVEGWPNPLKPARLGREKEPLVISLATKYCYGKGNYGANPSTNFINTNLYPGSTYVLERLE
jgi:hypothetical protein